jgi:hypothetical protein
VSLNKCSTVGFTIYTQFICVQLLKMKNVFTINVLDHIHSEVSLQNSEQYKG